MIYFSSDFHGYHANICRGTSSWDDKNNNCRDFDTIEEMNNAIIASINSVVGEDDTLYHLGDWALGGWQNIWHLRKQIKCKNIIQICGNHDLHIIKDRFFPFLANRDGEIFEIEDKNSYLHMGILKSKHNVTAKDLFKEVYYGTESTGIEIEIEGQKIILNHYPLETWNGIEAGSWMLHGHEHCHNKNNEFGKIMDVGWCGYMKPLSFYEIKEIMDSREITLKGQKRTH